MVSAREAGYLVPEGVAATRRFPVDDAVAPTFVLGVTGDAALPAEAGV
jgi:hypothetical protein